MKRYYSKIDTWIFVTLLASIAVMWLPLIPIWNGDSMILSIAMTVLVAGCTWLITSIMMSTYYWFESGKIYWRTGPFKGHIAITDIKKVSRAQSITDISAMIKPCLTSRPLLLRYSTYDDLPVSPKDETEFVHELKRLRSDLKINLS